MKVRIAEIRLLVALATSALALSACAVPLAYGEWRETQAQAYSVAQIRQDPAAFISANEGERVLVEGYFLVDRLGDALRDATGGPLNCESGKGADDLVMLPNLALNRALFDETLRRHVVVEARISRPRNLLLGGGDLIVPFAAEDMVVVLDDARLLAVDWSGEPCVPTSERRS